MDCPAEWMWPPSARGSWGHGDRASSVSCLRPRPLTRAALLQLLHRHWLAGWWWVLHAAQQRLHKAGPVGRADAYVVPWLILEPLLASSVQAHQDRGPAAGEERGQLQGMGGRMWGQEEEEGARVWGGRGWDRRGVGGVFLTWTCCFEGFPLRGRWPGTSSSCARASGLAGRGQAKQSLSQGARRHLRVGLGPLESQEGQQGWGGGSQGAPGSSWRPSACALSRYLWRFQLRLGLKMSRVAALASSPTQKVSQEA